MRRRWLGFVLLAVSAAAQAQCPPWLQQPLPRLHSTEQVDLCRLAGKPLLVVNTASFCGFTKQFAGLETLHQRYKERGLVVLGVPSDDFLQESDDAQETARVCYVNFGVTFTMTAPQPVTGENATALFRELGRQSGAPRWNFYKYVVGRDGQVRARFSSLTRPDDPALIEAIESVLQTP